MTTFPAQIPNLFTSLDRALERIYFYTSSTEKYLQARRVFDRYGLIVDYYKRKTEPYEEDYGGSSEDLLRKALSEVTDQVESKGLVFIEDTSLRIEALSTSNADFPGLQVKGWFAETSFEECDRAIKTAGGDRRAIVKSDIALSLPGLKRPIFFHAESTGTVAEQPPRFETNPQYPWLTPDTFNGWFIPDGCSQPLGAMPPDQAWDFDFRIRAFERMIERLEEYTAALNLPGSAYRRKRKLHVPQFEQPALFRAEESQAPALLVIGRTCAGKTTIAEYLSGRHGFRYIEASSVVRSLSVERLETDDRDGFAFAARVLDTYGHDVVAREIVEKYGADLELPFVVSGLRDLAEIRYMKNALSRSIVVLIEASERTRFDRNVRRGRTNAETKLLDFRRRDRRQDAFGLLPVGEDIADIRILNEGRMEDFHIQIDELLVKLTQAPGGDSASPPRHGPRQNQLFRCLEILRDAGEALSCDVIESRSVAEGYVRIRHNNANKVLKAVPPLANRIDPSNGIDSSRVRYHITTAGQIYLQLMASRPRYGDLSGS